LFVRLRENFRFRVEVMITGMVGVRVIVVFGILIAFLG
jgi:hypothetical protein